MEKNNITGDQGNFKIKGEHFFFSINPKIKEGTWGFKMVKQAIQNFVRKNDCFWFDLLTKVGVIQEYKRADNLIVTTGRSVLARRLAGDTTYTGAINYGALGSGSTAFTNGSTQLNTEVYRKLASSLSYDSNIAYADYFIASGDIGNQTFREWGTFIDGGAVANTGQAFSLLITGGWIKSGSIYISCKYTIN
jgi:hypothetical protein